MSFNPRDSYFKKAKEQGFAARSVFKLEEIDRKHRLLRPGQKILDLGAAPGSWSQYCAKRVGPSGSVLGIDLTEIKIKLANAFFLQADLREVDLWTLLQDAAVSPPYDLVLSDMAPKTTGIRVTDQARSLELCEIALTAARRFGKKGGHFVCKLFHSDEFSKIKREILLDYNRFEALRPDSTRKMSKEIFLIGLEKKNDPQSF
ncbi:MAG: RlmE family RNA methyltransferase [Bdellovibrionaceae bacterium]|nr:RlmE family RNA methyltransferase [Pseudobdellovibrionaceae bacterium]